MDFEVCVDGQEVTCTVLEESFGLNSSSDKEDASTDTGVTIKYDDVIALETSDTAENDEQKSHTHIHYIKRHEDKKLTNECIDMTSALDKGQYNAVIRNIEKHFTQVAATRPKKLLVLINPIGGRGLAVKSYHTIMEPLFDLAKITCDTVVSEHPKHLIEVIEKYDSSSVDGVVMLGGDGTYTEIVNVLMKRAQIEAGLDYNNHDVTAPFVPLKIPLGIIPTGTGNGVAECLTGCKDVMTSTLHVIKGKTKYTEVIGSYADGKLLGYCGCIFGLGFAASLLDFVDRRLRWMKTLRYLFGTLIAVIKPMNVFDLEFTVYKKNKTKTGPEETTEFTKEVFRQDCCMTMLFPFSLVDRAGGVVTTYAEEREFSLAVYKPVGKFTIFKHFRELGNRVEKVMKRDFINMYHGHAVTFKLIGKDGVPAESIYENRIASVDGEVQEVVNTEYHTKILEKAICSYYSD